jgi:4-hydroxy-2-oxoheptanedioate aldolase
MKDNLLTLSPPRTFVNPLKAKIRAKQPVFGAMATMPSPAIAQIFARSGFDFVVIDMEHSPIDIASAQAMIAATSGSDIVPLVRVPWNLHWLVKPALDCGALGVVFPLVRNREEAETAVRSTRYAPEGDRGWGPFHAQFRWDLEIADYVRMANEQIYTELLIEHVDAILNLDKILETPGIDCAFIAPGDLAVSLGVGGDLHHPKVAQAIETAEAIILESGVCLGGVACNDEHARRLLDRGYGVVTLGFDWMILKSACSNMLSSARRPVRAVAGVSS